MKEIIEIIKSKVLARNWSFSQISNLKTTIETLAQETYSELSLMERYTIVRDTRMNDSFVGMLLEDVFREIVMTTLRGEIAEIIRNLLENATVDFGGNKNEISERSVGGKSHQERTTDEKEDSTDEE